MKHELQQIFEKHKKAYQLLFIKGKRMGTARKNLAAFNVVFKNYMNDLEKTTKKYNDSDAKIRKELTMTYTMNFINLVSNPFLQKTVTNTIQTKRHYLIKKKIDKH